MIKLFLLLILLPPLSHALAANWIQGEAQMQINGAPLDEIREKTIKNAIADASYKAGSMITSEDIVLNGLLVGSKVVLQTQGLIRRAEVLSETINDDVLNIQVRVDLTHEGSCPAGKYNKKLLINQFRIMNPKQAAIGSMFELGRHVSKRIEQQFEFQSNQSSTLLLEHSFTDNNAINGFSRKEITQKANYLQREYGYQFALFGIIRDLSVFDRVTKSFLKDEVTTRRSFTIRIYLLDIYNQTISFEDSYHAEANWDFELNYSMDINSSIFWQSDYGRAVLGTISNAMIDVMDVIDCSPSFAQIIDTNENGYLINIGSQHGVKIGDHFRLHKINSELPDNPLLTRVIQPIKNSQMKVIATNLNTSILYTDTINSSITTRVYDLVSPMH